MGGGKVKVIVLHVFAIGGEEFLNLVQTEACEFKVKAEVFQLAELERQKFFVPSGV